MPNSAEGNSIDSRISLFKTVNFYFQGKANWTHGVVLISRERNKMMFNEG